MFAGLDNIFMTAYSACTASIINSNKLIICRNDLPIPLVVAMDPAQTKIDGCEAFNQPAWNWVENISQAFWHIICSLRDTRVLSFSQLERHQWAGVSNHPSSKAATVAIFMALWTRMECNGEVQLGVNQIMVQMHVINACIMDEHNFLFFHHRFIYCIVWEHIIMHDTLPSYMKNVCTLHKKKNDLTKQI